MINKNRRVVITGLGVVSSLGIGHKPFWKNLIAGKSGISKVTAFDTSEYERHYAGEIKDFDPTKFMHKKKAEKIGRASQMAIAASKLTLKDSSINCKDLSQDTAAVSIGTTMGGIGILEDFNLGRNELVSLYPSTFLSSNIALELKLRGPNTVFTTACASGNYAIAQTFEMLRSGRTNFALAGGVDGFSRIVFTGFGRLFAMAPEKCQPFDRNRKGMIAGEGAGILFLETLESAQKRNAKIYAEVLGYGLSCDARHMTASSPDGVSKAITNAMEDAKVRTDNVDYISAHGTGTRENDVVECKAFHQVFGKKIKDVPISSIKSMTGHTMGAAAAIEAVACCLAIKNSRIPPTINFNEKDPECDIDCVPNKARKRKVNVALNNSQAFGGNNACLVLRKVE